MTDQSKAMRVAKVKNTMLICLRDGLDATKCPHSGQYGR